MAFGPADGYDEERQNKRWLAIIAVVIPVCTFVLIAGWFVRAYIIPPSVSVQLASERAMPSAVALTPSPRAVAAVAVSASRPSAVTPISEIGFVETARPNAATVEPTTAVVPVELYRAPAHLPASATIAPPQPQAEPVVRASRTTTASGGEFEALPSSTAVSEAATPAAPPANRFVTASAQAHGSIEINPAPDLTEPVPLPRARQPYHPSGLVIGPIPLPRAKPGDISPTSATADVSYDRHTVN